MSAFPFSRCALCALVIIYCQQSACDGEQDEILAIRRAYVEDWAEDEDKDRSKKEYDGQQIVEVLEVFRFERPLQCSRQLVKRKQRLVI